MRIELRPGTRPTKSEAASMMVFTTAGAPPIIVTWCRSIRSRISGPSTLRSMM